MRMIAFLVTADVRCVRVPDSQRPFLAGTRQSTASQVTAGGRAATAVHDPLRSFTEARADYPIKDVKRNIRETGCHGGEQEPARHGGGRSH